MILQGFRLIDCTFKNTYNVGVTTAVIAVNVGFSDIAGDLADETALTVKYLSYYIQHENSMRHS